MRALRRLAVSCLGLLTLAVVTAPGVARGQVARHPSEIPIHLQVSTRLMRSALENIGDRERADSMTWQAYVQLRDAQAKLQNLNALAKFPNPLYGAAIPQVQEARNHLLNAQHVLKYRDPAEAPVAAGEIGEALRVIEALLLTTF